MRRRGSVLIALFMCMLVVSTAFADTVYVPLALRTFTTPALSPTTTPANVVRIQGTNIYRSDSGIFVVGEVINGFDSPVYMVLISVYFYDANNQFVSHSDTYAYLQETLPGQRNPFRIQIGTDPSIVRYELVVNWDTTYSRALQPYTTLSQQQIYSPDLKIIGTLRNDQGMPLTIPTIVATCYDEDANVLDTDVGSAANNGDNAVAPNDTVDYVTVGFQRPNVACAQVLVQAQGVVTTQVTPRATFTVIPTPTDLPTSTETPTSTPTYPFGTETPTDTPTSTPQRR